jgi:hypothetical protein
LLAMSGTRAVDSVFSWSRCRPASLCLGFFFRESASVIVAVGAIQAQNSTTDRKAVACISAPSGEVCMTGNTRPCVTPYAFQPDTSGDSRPNLCDTNSRASKGCRKDARFSVTAPSGVAACIGVRLFGTRDAAGTGMRGGHAKWNARHPNAVSSLGFHCLADHPLHTFLRPGISNHRELCLSLASAKNSAGLCPPTHRSPELGTDWAVENGQHDRVGIDRGGLASEHSHCRGSGWLSRQLICGSWWHSVPCMTQLVGDGW